MAFKVDNKKIATGIKSSIPILIALILSVIIVILVYNKNPIVQNEYANTSKVTDFSEQSVLNWYKDFSMENDLEQFDAVLVCGYTLDNLYNLILDDCIEQGITPEKNKNGYIIIPDGYYDFIKKSLYLSGAETLYGITVDDPVSTVICAVG